MLDKCLHACQNVYTGDQAPPNKGDNMKKCGKYFINKEATYAVMNDCRNWWIVCPIIDGQIDIGSERAVFVNGTYADAVATVKELSN